MRAPRALLGTAVSIVFLAGCGGSPATLPDGGGPLGDGNSPPGDGSTSGTPPTPTATGCVALTIDSSTKIEGSSGDTYAWRDAACKPRAASLLRNEMKDAFGEMGGYLRSLTYEAAGATRVCRGTGGNGWQGFGYIINHYASTASETQQIGGTHAIVLGGRHHAVHQYKWRINPGGPVDVTAQWVFATGRDHPLFSITFDATPAGKDVVNADTRAPYGDLAFDVTPGNVDGIAWGDKYRFTTKGAGPVTPTSAWDYTAPNTIPFDLAWSSAADAEMGLVQTQAYDAKWGGGDYGGGLLASKWNTSGTSLLTDLPDWLWPYQLNQYELPFVTTSHRVAWGATYGAVGQSSYSAGGKTFSGYPYQSYAVHVALGTHSGGAVLAQVAEIETVQKTTLGATRGTVSMQGPVGVARSDLGPYAPAGWNHVYSAWDVQAAAGAATVTFTVAGGGKLTNPLLLVHGYSGGAPHLTWNGAPLTADTHYFATVDAASSTLWITLGYAVSGSGTLTIDP